MTFQERTLEATDWQILAELQADGRLSFTSSASGSTCHHRPPPNEDAGWRSW
jgi:hypothetical protein